MLIKRLAAILLSIMLLMQLSACKDDDNYTLTSYFQNPASSQGASSESHFAENSSDISSEGGKSDSSVAVNQSSSAPQQNSSKNEASSNGVESDKKAPSSSSQQSVSDNKASSNKPQSSVTSETKSEITIPEINCNHTDGDPYQNVSKTAFYANYEPSCCNLDASYRSKHGLLSGSLSVPGQYPQESANRPMTSGKYIRNTSTFYLDDGNTYVVLASDGKEAMRIHKAGGYITLEEVAAYMFAFGGNGDIPANYTSKKSGKPSSSIWGDYLRLNHSYFIGDTDRYPYEPELPNISGCGGDLGYYEMDIGTTGTVTPGYTAKPYVQNNKITRGAARLVYARQDLNFNGVYENNEVYVFYTHNHYNDFREYLNYYGGWGEVFGNVTGGGVFDSETRANPTPYVQTAYKNFLPQ